MTWPKRVPTARNPRRTEKDILRKNPVTKGRPSQGCEVNALPVGARQVGRRRDGRRVQRDLRPARVGGADDHAHASSRDLEMKDDNRRLVNGREETRRQKLAEARVLAGGWYPLLAAQ